MPDHLINQLHFSDNSKHILDLLKSKKSRDNSPPQFSLNSIKLMPEPLYLPLNGHIIRLSIMNMEMPQLDDVTRQVALSNIFLGQEGKPAESEIPSRIEEIRETLLKSKSSSGKMLGPDKRIIESFKQAISNYHQYGFFSQYDWQFANWGSIGDIVSITESTFTVPTTYIEFVTKWTPPIQAIQLLSNAFSSIRFELKYHYQPDIPWTSVELFPNPPFSY